MRLSSFLALSFFTATVWTAFPEPFESGELEDLLDKLEELNDFEDIEDDLQDMLEEAAFDDAKVLIRKFLFASAQDLETGAYPRFFAGAETTQVKVEDLIHIQKRAEESLDGGPVLTFPEVESILKGSDVTFLEKVKEALVCFGLYRLIFKTFADLNSILNQEYEFLNVINQPRLDKNVVFLLILRHKLAVFKANPQKSKPGDAYFSGLGQLSGHPNPFLLFSPESLNRVLDELYALVEVGKPRPENYFSTADPNDHVSISTEFSSRKNPPKPDELEAVEEFVNLCASYIHFKLAMKDFLLDLDDIWSALRILLFKDFPKIYLSAGHRLPWLKRFSWSNLVALQSRVNNSSLCVANILTTAEVESILGESINDPVERAGLVEFLLQIAATNEILLLSDQNLESLGAPALDTAAKEWLLHHIKHFRNFDLNYLLSVHALLKKRLKTWDLEWSTMWTSSCYIDKLVLNIDLAAIDENDRVNSRRHLETKLKAEIVKIPPPSNDIFCQVDETKSEKEKEKEKESTIKRTNEKTGTDKLSSTTKPRPVANSTLSYMVMVIIAIVLVAAIVILLIFLIMKKRVNNPTRAEV